MNLENFIKTMEKLGILAALIGGVFTVLGKGAELKNKMIETKEK